MQRLGFLPNKNLPKWTKLSHIFSDKGNVYSFVCLTTEAHCVCVYISTIYVIHDVVYVYTYIFIFIWMLLVWAPSLILDYNQESRDLHHFQTQWPHSSKCQGSRPTCPLQQSHAGPHSKRPSKLPGLLKMKLSISSKLLWSSLECANLQVSWYLVRNFLRFTGYCSNLAVSLCSKCSS